MLFDLVDLNMNTDSSSEGSSSEVKVDEDTIIKYYFQHWFSYEVIILLLAKHHKHEISYRTPLRRLKAYGLGRRGFFTKDDSNSTIQIARQYVSEIINGPGLSGEYRTIWHTLAMEGLQVPCIIVQDILKELDPEGLQLRKAHHLREGHITIEDPMIPGTWIDMIN